MNSTTKTYFGLMPIVLFLACSWLISGRGCAQALPCLTFGSSGSQPGQLNFPFDVETDGSDRIVVSDMANFRVQVFDSAGSSVLTFGSFGSQPGQFNSPAGVATDGSDRIIVTDRVLNRVQVFDSSGNFLFTFGSPGSLPGQFTLPEDVATDSTDRIIVADTINNRIQVFSASGNFLFAFGTAGNGPGQFNLPQAVATDGADRIVVADLNNNRIQVFDSGGNFMFKFGMAGVMPGEFQQPLDVAIDGQDRVIVTEVVGDRVQGFDSDGNFLFSFGSLGLAPGQFAGTFGVATDGQDRIIVADGSNRIQIFDPRAGALPGTCEDLVTDYSANGSSSVGVGLATDIVNLNPLDTMGISHSSPGGSLVANGEAIVVGSTLATGQPFPTPLAGLHVNIPTAFLIFAGTVQGNPLHLPAAGISYGFTYAGGLTGFSVVIQCLVSNPAAKNGLFAASNGLKLDFQ